MNTSEKIQKNIAELLRKIEDVDIQIDDAIIREMACAVSTDEGVIWNEKVIGDLQNTRGETSGGWDVYQPSSVIPSELLLGMAEWENTLSDKNEFTELFLEKIPNYHRKGNYFTIPKLASMNQALFWMLLWRDGKTAALR